MQLRMQVPAGMCQYTVSIFIESIEVLLIIVYNNHKITLKKEPTCVRFPFTSLPSTPSQPKINNFLFSFLRNIPSPYIYI
jgi:hypothetical protein